METIQFALGPIAWSARQRGFEPILTLSDIENGGCLATQTQIMKYLAQKEFSRSTIEQILAEARLSEAGLANPIVNGNAETLQMTYCIPKNFSVLVRKYLSSPTSEQ